ncbi:hypothetical protein [Streptomyces sp. SID12501]|uniref:NERD domain-containing protein n=1 Tax=Streptomyces sp. SID12501 TaxID=2706042 RepID=A0A6B3C694_9ACTN|nr:hypothetical protein [Streptomyces sp. SID12501]NEC92303.1 hypothetical protein [Streptomyces sp. SID12501]
MPGSANFDHTLPSPCGTAVFVLNSKRWHARLPTHLRDGRVHFGDEDRHGQIDAVARSTARLQDALAMPDVVVWPLLVVHGSPVAGGVLDARSPRWAGPVYVLRLALKLIVKWLKMSMVRW